MKFETFLKLSAVGVAAATTAAGSLLVTAKAVKKLGDETFPDDPGKKGLDLTHVPGIDKLLSSGLKVSESLKTAAENDEEPIFKSDFKYVAKEPAPVAPVVPAAPEVVPQPPVAETPVVQPVIPVEPPVQQMPIPQAPVVAEVPVEAPVMPFASPAVPEPIPVVPAAPIIPVPEPVPVPPPVEEKYTDVPMELPYLAGKLAKDESDCADVVITPADKKNEEPVVDEPVVEAPVAEPVFAEPIVEAPVAQPMATEPVVAPLVETSAEPIAEMADPMAGLKAEGEAPEIVLPTSHPIDEHPHAEPIMSAEKPADSQTFADINPLAQGFSVAMSDAVADTLPAAADTMASFADLTPVQPAPTTFSELNSEYVEEVSPVVEVKAAEAPAVETPVVAEPEETPEIVTVAVPETAVPAGRTSQIGGAIVSDEASNPAVSAVASAFNVPHQNLVSISAEGNAPMVFEFLYSDMRNDASLLNVYFILPDGQATLPPETDRENVLAFGRNFITGNEELKAFLA